MKTVSNYYKMIRRIRTGVKSFIADKNKKKTAQIFKEFLILWIEQRRFPFHYFSRFLYRTNYKNYKDYLSTPELMKLFYSDKIQNSFFVDILENKLFFALLIENNDLPAPKLFGYNSAGNFYWNQKKMNLKSNSDLVVFFHSIFKNLNISRIFIKSIKDKGGTGIFLLQEKYLEEQIKNIGTIILNGSYIYQECLTQHSKINKIYDKSINTLRIDVCTNNNDIPYLLGSVMRFGRGGSEIDNRSKGGFCVSIDDTTGCLQKKGFTQMKFGSKEFYKHPDSNFVFDGFKIPFYAECRQLALDLSINYPNKIIGWDIAITPNGPSIIEGNHNTNLTMSEVGYGGYKKHPLIKEMLETTI